MKLAWLTLAMGVALTMALNVGCEVSTGGDGDGGAGDGDGGAGNDGQPGATVVIEMQGPSLFTPREVTVARGQTVRWRNVDAVPHTATSDTGVFASDGGFPSGLALDDTWEWTVPDTLALGDYYYYCRFHATPGDGTGFGRGMVGSISVE